MPGGPERRWGVSAWDVTGVAVRYSAWLGVAVIFLVVLILILRWSRAKAERGAQWRKDWSASVAEARSLPRYAKPTHELLLEALAKLDALETHLELSPVKTPPQGLSQSTSEPSAMPPQARSEQ